MKTTPVGTRQPLEGWPSVEDIFQRLSLLATAGFARQRWSWVISLLYQQNGNAILENVSTPGFFEITE